MAASPTRMSGRRVRAGVILTLAGVEAAVTEFLTVQPP
jgi:hypothetical protein